MPAAVRTQAQVWKNLRDVNTGSPTQSRLPPATAIRYDDIDISETSNSAKLSCRQKISEGCMRVVVSAIPSGFTAPLSTGSDRGLEPITRLSCRSAITAALYGSSVD